jgi:hypothetical protein
VVLLYISEDMKIALFKKNTKQGALRYLISDVEGFVPEG